MSSKMSRDSYRDIIAENLDWLAKQPRTLEREHIRTIVEHSERHEYDDAERIAALEAAARVARDGITEAIEMMGNEISNGTDWIGVDGDPNHALAILRHAIKALKGVGL